MKTYLTLLFLTISILGNSQTIGITEKYTILKGSGDTINQIINHQKEGWWIYYPRRTAFIHCDDCGYPYIKWYTIPYIISTGKYLHDKKQGLWVQHHPNGSVAKIFQYENGLAVNNSLAFYEDGSLQAECTWKNGQLLTQDIFYKNFIRWFHAEYIDGDIVQFKIFHENGSLKYQGSNVHNWKVTNLIQYDLAAQQVPHHHLTFMDLIFDQEIYDFFQF